MTQALLEAQKAFKNGEVPIGAVVTLRGQIIGRGYNQRESLKDPTAHAEMIAITAAANYLGNWRLEGCELIVTKEPCPMCAGAVVNARIDMVGFGAYDDKAGCCGSLYQLVREPGFNHQATVRGGILKQECEQLLKEFFFLQRNKKL
ncbi:MAG: nucleoside deaminase [FCB group bacterium]|nr:nucleoside deaminase [FCB group bacterium]